MNLGDTVMLRKILFAAVFGLLAAPAHAETNGSIAAAFASTDFGLVDLEDQSIAGAIYHGFDNGFGLQGEAALHNADNGGGFDENYGKYALHGIYRTETWAAGVVVGQSELYFSDIDIYGAEGAFYLDRFTIGASYLRGDTDFNQELDRLALEARYFITDNLSVGAGGSLLNYETPVIDGEGGSYDINAEYRFANFPVAISAGFGSTDLDVMRENETWRVALRWDIGTSSLIDRDRRGASFDDVDLFLQEAWRID